MLYLVAYENADPLQDQRIQEILTNLGGKKVLSHTWIVDAPRKTVLDILWAVRLGENLRILAADVSHAHFATVPYSDVRGMFRKPPE
ncbi:MAG TPA: hypothetical protein VHD76_17220 [Bryobacteraceae bacterium]|jgi:hypothetical protein|nr:hypothetical protein [Bryobacteraceae bacterium]